jgi:hypothetical protein
VKVRIFVIVMFIVEKIVIVEEIVVVEKVVEEKDIYIGAILALWRICCKFQ